MKITKTIDNTHNRKTIYVDHENRHFVLFVDPGFKTDILHWTNEDLRNSSDWMKVPANMRKELRGIARA